jgi:hypothetical protein
VSAATLVSLVGAAAALVTAVAGLVSALRGHQVVNNEIRPNAQANTSAVLRLAEDASTEAKADVKRIVNGAAPK